MTKFQVLFVLYLRHQSLCDCSLRTLAAHYYNRYEPFTKEVISFDKRNNFLRNGLTFGGNQIEGMQLEEKAFDILIPNPLFREPIDLHQCDLTLIEANLKRHIDKIKKNGKT